MKSSNARTTIDDVAREAGVSTATVSRVLNGTGKVRARTAAKVEGAIATLDYVPDGAARNLARGRKQVIGITLPGVMAAHYVSLLQGIDAVASQNCYSMLIHVNYTGSDKESEQLVLGDHNTDGLLVFTNSVSDADLIRLETRGFPVVSLFRTAPAGTDLPSVKLANRPATLKLMAHLIEKCGCRRIAHIRGPIENEDANEREQAYRDSLVAHHLDLDEEIIGCGNFVASESEDLVEKWLANGKQFDAIFGGDDNSAVGAMAALRKGGIRVPEDVAVVGFNDDTISQHQSPPLTTVRADASAIGEQAAQLLFRLINGDAVQSLTMVPSELIVRQSCGFYLKH